MKRTIELLKSRQVDQTLKKCLNFGRSLGFNDSESIKIALKMQAIRLIRTRFNETEKDLILNGLIDAGMDILFEKLGIKIENCDQKYSNEDDLDLDRIAAILGIKRGKDEQ